METAQHAPAHGFRTFATIWSGQLISVLGSGLTGFALGLWVYEETGSPTLFAISLLTGILPHIFLSPLAGVIADRWDRRLVMILSDTGAGITTLFIAVMVLTGRLQVWHVYLANFFGSAFSSFQWPAYSAATSLLVPKKHLGRASGMVQAADAISTLITPAVAGTLYVTAGGLRTVLVIDVLSYLFAVGTLLLVRFPRPPRSEEGEQGKGTFWQEATFGWHYIRRRPGLLGLLSVFATENLIGNLGWTLIIPYLLELTTPDRAGYIMSVFGLGTLAGTLAMSAWGGPKRRIYGIIVFEFGLALSLIVMGIRPLLWLIAVSAFIGGVAGPMSNACSQAIWQTKVAHDVQGRVFAIRRMIALSIMPVGYLLAGPLAEKVFTPLLVEGGPLAGTVVGQVIGVGPGRGMGLQFVLLGLLYTLAASVIALHPRIRRLELEIPDAASAGELEKAVA